MLLDEGRGRWVAVLDADLGGHQIVVISGLHVERSLCAQRDSQTTAM
jgi:hypothetical protein